MEQPRQEQRLAGFIELAAHGGATFQRHFLRQAHAHLAITDAVFARRRELADRAVAGCGLGDEVAAAWRALDLLFQAEVVNAVRAP